MRHAKPVRAGILKDRLDTLVATFDISTIEPDPLQLVLRYDDPLDQEVAALLAAAFAYGRAETIVANIGVVLTRMTPSPYRYLAAFDRAEATRRFAGFAHRFHKTPELVALLGCVAAVIREHGSVGELFRVCHEPRDADIGKSLERFVMEIRESSSRWPLAGGPLLADRERPASGQRDEKHRAALQYLLPSPKDGSACKRMNLFLRWMVRRTPPDLGLWTFVDPASLVMPVDTHIHRIATFLGLNDRKSADWKAARGITDRLAQFDAADPVRYDFALCRLGILDHCSRKKRKENCDVCLLRDACRFPA